MGEGECSAEVLQHLQRAAQVAQGLANTERSASPDWSKGILELRKSLEAVLVQAEAVVGELGRIRNQAMKINSQSLAYERDIASQLEVMRDSIARSIRELEEVIRWKGQP